MAEDSGKLKIGDDWNAIRIIALSQNNPLKAIAEFVENSIDAGARSVDIVRGKQDGQQYLRIIDDGQGIADFKYLATHIGDSIKRKLKKQGAMGIQGEFGIGLLSFWTVGEECVLSSQSGEGAAHSLRMVKGNPGFSIRPLSGLFPHSGTELCIKPLLPGVRLLSGEKIQNYLASELRDRISKSGVRIRIVDKTARCELTVEPRKFRGRLLHQLPALCSPLGDIYVELYLCEPSSSAGLGLYKQGTRVMPDIRKLEEFDRFPWNSANLEGIIDASFLQLTPGTRDGIVLDDAYESFIQSLMGIEAPLGEAIDELKKAQEEEASKSVFQKLSKAFREAFLFLPQEDYGWLAAQARNPARAGKAAGASDGLAANSHGPGANSHGPGEGAQGLGEDGLASANPGLEVSGFAEDGAEQGPMDGLAISDAENPSPEAQLRFFEHSGPLYSILASPASSVIGLGCEKRLKAVARDRARRAIEAGVEYQWSISDGSGELSGTDGQFVTFKAGLEPGISVIRLWAREGEEARAADAIITVTAELIPRGGSGIGSKKGLPGYTFQRAPGELWRSRYDMDREIIIVNSAHADFIYASRQQASKLRYIMRLYAKELVLANFPEADKSELLERMVELVLYTEDKL